MNIWLILVVLNIYWAFDAISSLRNFYRSNMVLIKSGKEPFDIDTVNLMLISYLCQFITINVLGILGSILWSSIPEWWEVGLFVITIMLVINIVSYTSSFLYVQHVKKKQVLEEVAKAKQGE